MYNIVIFTV